MLSELVGNSLDEVHASVDALWERLGIDDEQLAKGFNEFAIDGQRAMRLDAAGFRAGVDGTQNVELAKRNGTHEDTTNDKKEQHARVLSNAISAVELNQLILSISLEIEEVTEQLAAIEARQEEIRVETEELTQEVAVLEEALDGVNETDLAVERATADLLRADDPEAVAGATTALAEARISREEALESAQNLLGAEATATDIELIRLSLENSIADIRVALHELREESDELSPRHDELTARLDELEASLDTLMEISPEDIANGEYTNETIMRVLPEDMQASYMDHLTGMLETGWEYTQEFAENTIAALSTRLSSTLQSIGLGGVFSNAHDNVTPETPDEPVVQVAQTPQPATPTFQPTNTM